MLALTEVVESDSRSSVKGYGDRLPVPDLFFSARKRTKRVIFVYERLKAHPQK